MIVRADFIAMPMRWNNGRSSILTAGGCGINLTAIRQDSENYAAVM
jgi:hypothetical protein